jgi:hypothetical protein
MTSITELKASVLSSVEEMREVLKSENDEPISASFFETFEKVAKEVKELKKANKKAIRADLKESATSKKKKAHEETSEDSSEEKEESPKEKKPKEKKQKVEKPKEKKEKSEDSEKKKRAPSKYNLFLKEKIAALKAEDEENGNKRTQKERLQDVAALWKAGGKDTFMVDENISD